jgi:hypothetical protein
MSNPIEANAPVPKKKSPLIMRRFLTTGGKRLYPNGLIG